jgi:hypothetical protein
MINQLGSVAMIQLTGEQIDGEIASCTGSQLVRILKILKEYHQDLDWYIADISANQILANSFAPTKDDVPRRVGNIEQLINLSEQVDQFFSGIFLAISEVIPSPQWNRSFVTEDCPTEDLGDALIEIRAFDTTYFEIYSSDRSLIESIAQRFHAK